MHEQQDQRQQVRPLPTIAAAAALLVCTGGPSTYFSLHYVRDGRGWQSWTHVVPFSAVAIVGLVALAIALRATARAAWPWPVYAVAGYVAITLASVLWSVSVGNTVRAALLGIGIAAFACWFGWCLSAAEQITAVVGMTTVAGAASWLVARYQPRYNLMFETLGSWQGIFGNRNSLAPVCALGLVGVAGLVALRVTAVRLVFALLMGWMYVTLLRHSGGATAVIALVLAGAVAVLLPLAWLARRAGVRGAAVAAILVATCAAGWVWIFTHIDDLAVSAGRNSDLTGRRSMWADVREFIDRRPLGGYGFWAFWERPDLTADTYARLGAYASAHNSWLEVLLGLGFVGLVVFLVIGLAAVAGVFARWWYRPDVGSAWWCATVLLVVAHHMTESFVLWHSYLFVLLVAAAFVPFRRQDGDDEEQVGA